MSVLSGPEGNDLTNQLRSQEEKILLEGRSSDDISSTLRYMKSEGFQIKSTSKVSKHRVLLTMKEDYYDDDIREILERMSKVFRCSVLATWGNCNE